MRLLFSLSVVGDFHKRALKALSKSNVLSVWGYFGANAYIIILERSDSDSNPNYMFASFIGYKLLMYWLISAQKKMPQFSQIRTSELTQ